MTHRAILTSKNEISGLICYVDTDSGLDFPHISLMSRASLIEPLCVIPALGLIQPRVQVTQNPVYITILSKVKTTYHMGNSLCRVVKAPK